jgi:tetratricopeptide (TPR) repeat protein
MLRGPEQVAWLDRLEVERDNLRAALGWIAEQGEVEDGLRMAVALSRYWGARGYLHEGRSWLESLLGASEGSRGSPSVRMRVRLAAGILAKRQGELAPAERLLSETLSESRALGDRLAEAEALAWLSSVRWQRGDFDIGLQLGEESLRLGYEIADAATIGFAHLNLGAALIYGGDPAQSVTHLEAGVHEYRGLRDQRYVAIGMTDLGLSLLAAGDHIRAKPILCKGVHELRVAGEQRYIIFGLLGLATVYHRQGQLRRAVRLLCASEMQRESIGMRHMWSTVTVADGLFESLRQQLSVPAFEAAYAADTALSLDQVLADVNGTP